MEKLYVQCSSKKVDAWVTICSADVADAQQSLDDHKQRIPDLRWRLVTIDQMSNRVDADWSISLDVTCPYCSETFDLLRDEWPEGIESCEHGTDRTTGYEFDCPGCDRKLLLDFCY